MNKPPKHYNAYLQTRRWARIRDAVIERDKVCQGCLQEPIEHVHHKNYKHVCDELLFELVGLCEDCHRKVHYRAPSWNPWTP